MDFLKQVQPYEESQSDSSARQTASPDELKAFYDEMQKREHAERAQHKLSRGKSSSGKSLSMWSRKKKPPSENQPPPSPTLTMDAHDTQNDDGGKENSDQLGAMLPRSIIPDPLGELPPWFNNKETDWAPAVPSAAAFRSRYPIHNPFGPRWYKNHHLIPPSQGASGRPPSVFSPSFPPMPSASPDSSEDPARAPGPSRTPSGSPQPTPNSSQTRLAGVGEAAPKSRTRKTSLTAHDNVDMMDGSDPHGTNWHHQSPYDPGMATSPVAASPEPSPPFNGRPRLASVTAPARHKTVTPSPLSQSTSAIHLQPPESQLPPLVLHRKLSKRRKPVFGALFTPKDPDVTSKVSPGLVSPLESPPDKQGFSSNAAFPSQAANGKPVRNSLMTLPMPQNQEKKEKRGSVLGRIGRKFSLMKRRTTVAVVPTATDAHNSWHHIESPTKENDVQRMASPEIPINARQSSDLSRRVPPPSMASADPPSLMEPRSQGSLRGDGSSFVSVEAPRSRLRVANPDSDSSGQDSPTGAEIVGSPIEEPPRPDSRDKERLVEQPPQVARTLTASPESTLPPLPDDASVSPVERAPRESPQAREIPQPELFPTAEASPAITPVEEKPRAAAEQPSLPALDTKLLPPPPLSDPEKNISYPTIPSPVTAFSPAIRPASFAAPVAPSENGRVPSEVPTIDTKRLSTSVATSAGDSPVSRTSMIVNPPTPYLPPVPMPAPTPAEVPVLPSTRPPLVHRDTSRSQEADTHRHHSRESSSREGHGQGQGKRSREEPRAEHRPRSREQQQQQQRAREEPQARSREDSHPRERDEHHAREDSRGAHEDAHAHSRSREDKRPREDSRGVHEDAHVHSRSREDKRPREDSRGAHEEPHSHSRSRDDKHAREESRGTSDDPARVRDDKHNPHGTSPTKLKSDALLVKEGSQRIKSGSPVASRETETFRLVRSPSGNVHNYGTMFTANGEQWEVVESEPPRRKQTKDSVKSHDRDRENGSSSRREQRYQEKLKAPAPDHHSKSHSRRPSANGRSIDAVVSSQASMSRSSRARSLEPPERLEVQDNSRSKEKAIASAPDVNKTRTLDRAEMERPQPSYARPNSEVPPTVELNHMTAREAWEMDRLWKGQSMHNGYRVHAVPQTAYSAGDIISTSPTSIREPSKHSQAVRNGGPGPGSSHTAFLVQTPFQGPPTVTPASHLIYNQQMASNAAAAAYASTPTLLQTSHLPSGHREPSSVHRPSPVSARSVPPPSTDRHAPLNPLPDPPRRSSYEPAPFPVLSDSNSGRSQEYWTSYNSVTAAH